MAEHTKVCQPSSAERWINCPPSALLNAQVKDETSEYALEGTCAHALAEYKVKTALETATADPRENLSFYNEEMETYTDGYSQFVEKKAKGADLVAVETRLDLTDYIPGGFGTADCVIIKGDTLTVIDLKYGGVIVESVKNSQLCCYALGALSAYGYIYDIKTVELIIYQPRREHISEWSISTDDLLAWGRDVLKPRAELASKGEGDFSPSESTCRWCKVKDTCRARAEFYLELAREEFKPPAQLSEAEIAEVLTKVDGLVSWASDVKEFATNQAMSGTHYTGFKLVEGRSVRKYTDEEEVAEAVEKAGYDPYERKVKGITAMKKLLGKRFDEIIGNYVNKPSGKPVLVPEGDKRQEINLIKNDFVEV